MKKHLPYLILFILAVLFWDAAFDPFHMSFAIDDADFEGPAGTLFGAALAGGGIVIALIVMVLAAIALAVLFAGAGIVARIALALAVVLTLLALSPLMLALALLIPVGIVWYLASSNRRPQRAAGI